MGIKSNRAGWTCVADNGGRRLFVKSAIVETFRELEKNYYKSYMWTQLYRAFMRLKSDVARGEVQDRSGVKRNLRMECGSIQYYLDNGDVLIARLFLGEEEAKGKSGLYAAKFYNRRNEWGIDEGGRRFSPKDKKNQWNGVHYAALGDDAKGGEDRVADYMANQLFQAYSKEVHKKTIESMSRPPSFSLYYIQEGEYQNSDHSEKVASLIQNAAENDAPVNWLIHGKAGITFKNALNHLKSMPSLNSVKSSKAKQEVFFSSTVGVKVTELDKLANEVGLKRHGDKGYNLNPFYIRSSYITGNAFAEIAMVGRLSSSQGDGKLTQTGRALSAALNNPVLGVALAGAGVWAGGAGIISKGLANTLGSAFAIRMGLSIAKGGQQIWDGFLALKNSNVGSGRYFFYENPTQLMKEVNSSKSLVAEK